MEIGVTNKEKYCYIFNIGDYGNDFDIHDFFNKEKAHEIVCMTGAGEIFLFTLNHPLTILPPGVSKIKNYIINSEGCWEVIP